MLPVSGPNGQAEADLAGVLPLNLARRQPMANQDASSRRRWPLGAPRGNRRVLEPNPKPQIPRRGNQRVSGRYTLIGQCESMSNRPTRLIHEATRFARWLLIDMGRELRLARIGSGMRQIDVARALGTSKSRICRVEQGRVRTLTLEALSRHAAVVGLKPYLKLFPLGRRLLDKPQIELLTRFRERLHASWSWETEVPMPIEGDLRSGDCRIGVSGCSVLVEAFTRFADHQRQTSNAARKKRDLGADCLILLVAGTHANRQAVAEARAVSDGSFPLGSRETLAALAEGRDPGGDAIVFL